MKGLSSIKKTLFALVGVLLATGVVLGGGVLLTEITRQQEVITIILTTTPAPSSISWDDQDINRAFAFSVKATNPTTGAITIHLELEAECPDSGVATLSGDATGDACGTDLSTSDKSIPALGSDAWSFSVTYTGAGGLYE